MSRRLRNPSTAGLLIGAAIVGGVAYWYFTKEKKTKEQAKTLPTGPKPGTVNLLPKIPDFYPEPPFVLLVYRDTETGRAALQGFQEAGKSVKVTLYAATMETYEQDLPGDSILVAQRLNGSWLETIEGEDQEQYVDNTPTQMRVVMDWAAGTGDLPLEGAEWLGEADTLWKELGVPPLPIDIQVDTTYKFPVPSLPYETLPVITSSHPGAVVASVSQDGEGNWWTFVDASERKPGVVLTLISRAPVSPPGQVDWKRQILVRPREAE